MADYISRERLMERIRGTGYAEQIKSNLLCMAAIVPAADVRPVVNTCETCGYKTEHIMVKPYDGACWYWKLHSIKNGEWCCHWKQREES